MWLTKLTIRTTNSNRITCDLWFVDRMQRGKVMLQLQNIKKFQVQNLSNYFLCSFCCCFLFFSSVVYKNHHSQIAHSDTRNFFDCNYFPFAWFFAIYHLKIEQQAVQRRNDKNSKAKERNFSFLKVFLLSTVDGAVHKFSWIPFLAECRRSLEK